MNLKSGKNVFENFLSDSIYQDTQEEKFSVSLTADKIYSFDQAGELDFGGGEYQPADKQLINPEKRNSDDDYGWWELSEGCYLLELNERLQVPLGGVAILQPHTHLVESGASHPTVTRAETKNEKELRLPLQVPSEGLSIKENARVTLLRIFTT